VLLGDATELDIAYHGEDTIHGGDGNDSLAGLGGNDLLYGGKGSDGYEFSTGDGLDIIVDTDGGMNGDSLNFYGIGGIGAVTLTLEAGDLHAKIDDEGFVCKNWNPSQFGGIYYYDSSGGFIDSQRASDVVSVANRAPTAVDATSNVQVLEDQPLSISLGGVGFADANGDSLSFSATLADGHPLPGWLQFDAYSLLVSGLPGNEAVGTHSILIKAEDPYGGSVSHTIRLEIKNLNDAPELVAPLPERSVTAGFDFEHDLSGYWTDPDVGDALTYSVSLENGDPLPGWLSFDAGSLVLTGSVPQDAAGDLVIRTVARDGSGTETSASYTMRFRSVLESIETSQLTLGQLSVPDPDAYYAFYLDRQYFEWQNGVLGDINGDGYDDYYFGTDTVGHALDKDRFRDRLGNPVEDTSAIVQIVYGEAGGWSGAPPRMTSFMLGSDSAFDQLGLPNSRASEVLLDAYRLTPLGDTNKDGFDDFALGDRMFWGSAAGLGESYVWEDLVEQPLLDPADGVDFSGAAREFTVMLDGLEQVVQAVNVGDINGDGIDDYVTPVNVSTYGTAFGSGFPGDRPPQQAPVEVEDELRINAMHVLYGRSDGLSGVIDLDQLSAEQGYAIQGFERFIETREYFGTVYDVNQVAYG
ncbi:MAG: putative Ig domain-containing protein, partial [Sedimenticolaceae bacterium]